MPIQFPLEAPFLKAFVAFKVWANMPVTILFAASQLPVITKFAEKPVKPIEAITPIDPLP